MVRKMLDPKGQAFFSEERRVKSEENRGSFASKHFIYRNKKLFR